MSEGIITELLSPSYYHRVRLVQQEKEAHLDIRQIVGQVVDFGEVVLDLGGVDRAHHAACKVLACHVAL